MIASIATKIKLIVAALLVIGAFIVGVRWGSVTTVIEKEVKGETVTVYKDRIITVTKIIRPDGTVEEITKTEEKDKTKKKKETKKEPVVVATKKPKYSVGYTLRPRWDTPDPSISHGLSIGYNLLDPLWLKFGAIPSDNIYTLGLEVQF